jgi:hypothetical protein
VVLFITVSGKYNKPSTRIDVHTGTERVFLVLALVCCVAADLSRHLGAPFLPGEEGGGSLSPGLKSVPMEVIESRWGGFTPFVGVQAVDIIVLAITLLSAIHVLR